ncbi:MAG: glycosyltransferase family 87 protein [Candidatus Omnitrophota bacterium]
MKVPTGKQRLWLAALLCLGILLFLQYDHRAPKRNFSDFHVTYTTGLRFLKGEPIYTYEGGLSYFKYPPFYAFFMGPFSMLSERNAARLWHVLNLFFLCFLFVTVTKMLPRLEPSKRPVLYLLAGIASFRILLENLHEGQANLFMLALLWCAIYHIAKGKNVFGGFLFAFSILTKYLSVLFVPVFLLEKRYRAVAWTLVFLVLLSFLPAAVVGFSKNAELLRECRNFLFESSLDNNSISTPPNQSLLASLSRLFYGQSDYGFYLLRLDRKELFALFFILSSLIYLVCLVSVKGKGRGPFSQLAAYGMLCLAMSLFNPNAWRNAFLPICVPYLVLFAYLFKVRWRDRGVLILTLLSFCFISLTSEFFVQEKGVKVTDFYSTLTLGAFCLFAALLKVRFIPRSDDAGEEVQSRES